ncbi:MAG: hypothetical protein HGA45_40855, partial [Chloroflexales bacterium]|nr:hypothetical protein [Chloroflexales bacterium]
MPDESPNDPLDERLRAAAAAFPYPPTPDLAAALAGRTVARRARGPSRWRLAAGLGLAALLVALLAVPEVRGAAMRLLQVGVVRVRLEPSPAPPSTPAPSVEPMPAPRLPDLAGATTLEAAAR